MTQPLNSVALRRLAVTGTKASAGSDCRAIVLPHACRSRFETLAEGSTSLSTGLEDVFGPLLAASCLPPSIAHWSHRMIWAEEAMHRAYSMLRLTLALRSRVTISLFEHTIASRLAADLRSLSNSRENEIVPCSRVLRDVVYNTGSLFGPAIGGLKITTDVEYVRLPAYKRRALVLLANELSVNALLHAFSGRSGGYLALTLRRVSGSRVRLRVEDDGIGFSGSHPDTTVSVASGLAEVLGASLVYNRSCGRSIAEIAFLVRGTTVPEGSVANPAAVR